MVDVVKKHGSMLLAWKESLAIIFVPKNLVLLCKATLNCMLRMYKTLLNFTMPLSYLFGALVVITFFFSYMLLMPAPLMFFLGWLWGIVDHSALTVIVMWWIVASMIVLFAARASVQQKDSAYFWHYISYSAPFLVIGFIAIFLEALILLYYPLHLLLIYKMLDKISALLGLAYCSLIGMQRLMFVRYGMMPLIITLVACVGAWLPFISLFWFDSVGKISDFFASVRRALLMIYYNYPLCLILSMIKLVLGKMMIASYFGLLSLVELLPFEQPFMSLLNLGILFFMPLLVLPILLAPFVVVYTKRVNEQYKYFW
jgi:hypothetical protein